jgi:hypothetical protein
VIDSIGNGGRPGNTGRDVSRRNPTANAGFFKLRADKVRPFAVVVRVADEDVLWHAEFPDSYFDFGSVSSDFVFRFDVVFLAGGLFVAAPAGAVTDLAVKFPAGS